ARAHFSWFSNYPALLWNELDRRWGLSDHRTGSPHMVRAGVYLSFISVAHSTAKGHPLSTIVHHLDSHRIARLWSGSFDKHERLFAPVPVAQPNYSRVSRRVAP